MTDEEKRLWAIAIGEFIIEFGGIESLVTEVVRRATPERSFPALRKLNFETRANLALSALTQSHASLEQELAVDFDLLDAIRKRRNVIAHNGFTVAVYELPNEENFMFRFGMSDIYKKEAVFLEISHLEDDTRDLAKIYSRLLTLMPPSTAFEADVSTETALLPPGGCVDENGCHSKKNV